MHDASLVPDLATTLATCVPYTPYVAIQMPLSEKHADRLEQLASFVCKDIDGVRFGKELGVTAAGTDISPIFHS